MNEHCSPTYGKVDDVLEMLTKSKSLHILMVLDRASGPLRFTELKEGVKASSTTVLDVSRSWKRTVWSFA